MVYDARCETRILVRRIVHLCCEARWGEKNSQGQIIVLIDMNGKVTFLVVWVIDALVENNPIYHHCGKWWSM
jgi:hypothetical protein